MTKNEIRFAENMNNIDGLDVIDVSLGSVLYNTKTKEYYTPNTNTTKSVEISENEKENIKNNKNISLEEEKSLKGQNFNNEGGDKQ